MPRTRGAKDLKPRTRRKSPGGYKHSDAFGERQERRLQTIRDAYDAAQPNWRQQVADSQARILAGIKAEQLRKRKQEQQP